MNCFPLVTAGIDP